MDAGYEALEQEKLQLLERVAEIEVRQQRQQGRFKKTPHFSEIEDAGQALGRFLSRLSQSRMASEAATSEGVSGVCPTCDKECRIEFDKRTVTGLDGSVEIVEPKGHCPACRRDFFPSA